MLVDGGRQDRGWYQGGQMDSKEKKRMRVAHQTHEQTRKKMKLTDIDTTERVREKERSEH